MLRTLAMVSLTIPLFAGCTAIGAAGGVEQASYIDPSEIGSYSARAQAAAFASQQTAAPRFVTATPTNAPVTAPNANLAPATTQSAARSVVYTATLRVVVASTADSLATVRSIATEAGGYLQESSAQSITIRVPASAFEAAIARLDRLGEVLERAIKATDVGEQVIDLDVRLANARQLRDRLAAHLAKSEKMEDTIKLEAELSRVTTDLEKLEAGRRLLASQIAMSTIRVDLNAARPQTARGGAVNSPFRWIDQLGDGLAGVAEAMPRQPVFLGGGPKFDPPAGFVRYFQSKDRVEAMNADGVRLRVVRNPNFDRGPIEFWRTLARKSLVDNRSLAITSEPPAASEWQEIRGTREVGGSTLGYVLLLSRTNDDVYAIEAWGPREAIDGVAGAVRKSAETLKR